MEVEDIVWPSDSQLPTEGQTERLQRGLGHPQAGGPLL